MSEKGSDQKVPNPRAYLIHQIALYGANIDKISQHMNISKRAIRKRLLVLEKNGYIKIEREGRYISEIVLRSKAIPYILQSSQGNQKGSLLGDTPIQNKI